MSKKSSCLYDEQFKIERSSELNDPIEKLNATVN